MPIRRRPRLACRTPVSFRQLPVQCLDEVQPRSEQPLAERFTQRAVAGRDVPAEVLQVLAVVEDAEELLFVAWTEQIRTQARATSEHLPELGLRHVEQLAHRDHRVVERNRSMPVYGAVAQCVDHPRRAEHRLAGGILETRVVDQRRQVVLVRQLQRRIVLLGPAHREFERAPCLEARRAWIGVHGRLGPHSGFEHRRPLALPESELAHAGASSSAASSSTYLR